MKTRLPEQSRLKYANKGFGDKVRLHLYPI
jgi:hypothetical protein